MMVLVFLLAVVVDIFFVFWSVSANRGMAWRTALTAVMIQVCGVMGTLFMVADPRLLVANAVGHGLGSYLAVVWTLRMAKRDEMKEQARSYHAIHGADATIEGCPCCFP